MKNKTFKKVVAAFALVTSLSILSVPAFAAVNANPDLICHHETMHMGLVGGSYTYVSQSYHIREYDLLYTCANSDCNYTYSEPQKEAEAHFNGGDGQCPCGYYPDLR